MAGCGGIFVCCSDLLQAQPPSESQITYSLRHTSAADIHGRLRTALPADSGAVDIGVDSANNRLVVRAPSQTQQLAGELVAALDQPAAAEPAGQTPRAAVTVKVYSIAPGRLEAVAAAVEQAYPSGSGVRVVPDPRTGQLLIVAPPDLQQSIAQQIERERGGKAAVEIASPAPGQSAQPVDAAVSNGTEGQLRLRHIGWQQLEAGLKQLLGGSLAVNAAGDGQQAVITLPAQADQKVQLRVDRASGVIAASGPPKAVEAWLEVIGAMDNPQPAAGQGTKLVALHRANGRTCGMHYRCCRTAAETAPATPSRSPAWRPPPTPRLYPGCSRTRHLPRLPNRASPRRRLTVRRPAKDPRRLLPGPWRGAV